MWKKQATRPGIGVTSEIAASRNVWISELYISFHCSSISVVEAIQAVEAAEKAFPAWPDTPSSKNRDLSLKAADIVDRRTKELAEYMMDETGSDAFFSGEFNIPMAADNLRDLAGRLSSISVILGIAPWNAPYVLGIRAVATAIAAGNTAILKGSEISPHCFWAIEDCFREAGFPRGIINVIAHKPQHAAAVTKALIENPSVRKINFTGSTIVGRVIGELAGRNLKHVLLEIGGKAPAIVWKDSDLKNAAKACAIGSFLHAGQICMSTERIIGHKSVAAEFEQELARVPPYSSEMSIQRNKTRMAPIVVKEVTTEMDIYHSESFGPTVSIFVVETEEEALRLANDTEYGLSSAVFIEDLRAGLRLANGIEAGVVHINGMSSSGYGRFGAGGHDEWLWTKIVTYKD
ncbi:ALDH-like protein [Hyaloscypha variabilis F]|uniref:ALDH-like protein n=1 Tax=Hyaloscypha variabilis (strain UAMH 11265 / GT02V1 / F) TaxID=1149755 RepID=A0A2J6RYV8_HYAVF|nr:ALDH-like protein [Hyaloscypha variabilis F]